MKRILFLISFFYSSFFSFGQNQAQECTLGFSYNISSHYYWGLAKPVVTSVLIDSPAEKAGLKINDIIEQINGIPTVGHYSGNISVMLQENRFINLTISNLGYKNKELTFSKDCSLMDAISEKQMASNFSSYSLGNIQEKIFTYPFKTAVQECTQINYLDYKTFGFTKNDPDNFPNNQIKTILEKRGLTYSERRPDLYISTNYLPEDAEQLLMLNISFIDPKYSTEETPYIVWQCRADDKVNIPLMLMQYPYTQTFENVQFRQIKKKYNYTGINYDINDFRKIIYVDPVSPAAQAGIKTGDIILKINDIKMIENPKKSNYNNVFSYLFNFEPYPTGPISFDLKRGKQQLNIQVEPIDMEFDSFETLQP